ncbi:signal peptidase II Aspartic peptidase. MEROPS family A08 [Melghirimyces algeriensis]|uniref:Lipoprotein signal peptidase n=1 Tax=Melghirimyces algeriensis TaxID=910412 RepID=A0A521BLM4_9BACL|nr:signal peptidase II Aspartic peptidase. MEROPS family A08 [Melghirimyces algeriensis]
MALVVLGLDQATKWLVVRNMNLFQTIPLWEGVFHITSHRNRGAAFGILQNQQWLFIVITIVVVSGITYYLLQLKASQPLMSWSLALILGGSIGNLIDRVRLGEVVDFLDFRLIQYPIFNVADSAIVVGVGIMIFLTIRQPSEKEDSLTTKEAGDSQ